MLESKEFNHKRSYIVNITHSQGPEFRSSNYLTNKMADFIKPVTINIFKFRRYIQLFDPTKCSIEALSHNEAKWTKTIDDLYNEILNAAAEVVTNIGVDQADTMVVESMLDAIEDEYREYFAKLRAKLNRGYNGAEVIVKKDVDSSVQCTQCEPHSRDSKVTTANTAHTADEHAGIESSQHGLQMVGNNGQVDVANMLLYPSAMEDFAAVQIATNRPFSVQMEASNLVQFTTESRDFVTRYTRVYNAAAVTLHNYGYRLYEYEEVRSQQDEVEAVLYNNATFSSRDKYNFMKKDFQYHRNEG